jgi:hypothetical protein
MKDKNLTDTEIIKALECCIKPIQEICIDCPLYEGICTKVDLKSLALDLINRLEEKNSNLTSDLTSLQNDLTSANAEIERLQKENETFADIGKMYSEIKAEAYKECIENAKKEIYQQHHSKGMEETRERYRIMQILDNLSKELVGEYKPPKNETKIKFEAYRECIEKIKQRAEYCSYSVAVNTITDNVLKDLEGEQNCE